MPNAFAHVELNTQDLKKAKKFYQSLFDWKLSEAPSGMPYLMIHVGTGTGGGMAAAQDPGAPSAWLPYVLVDDVKKTLAKAAKAGATIKLDYMPIGEMGAIGVFVDPTGAPLGIWEEAKAAPKATAKAGGKTAPSSAKTKAAAPTKKGSAPAKAKKVPAASKAAPPKKASRKKG
jgi:predicted enzyme related to lactoylglutathione lyase